MWGGKRDNAGGMTQMECRKRIAGMKSDNTDDDDDDDNKNDHDQLINFSNFHNCHIFITFCCGCIVKFRKLSF